MWLHVLCDVVGMKLNVVVFLPITVRNEEKGGVTAAAERRLSMIVLLLLCVVRRVL